MGDEVEYYLPNDDCTAGGTCPGEGVFVPQVLGDTSVDAQFVGSDADTQADLGLADIDSYPLTDELFPLTCDGTIMTLDGLLDCFARTYPERAQLLCAMIEQQGFEIEWHEDADGDIAAIRGRLNSMQRADWGMNAPMWSAEQRAERSRLYDRITELTHWRITSNKVIIHSRINGNIDVFNWFGVQDDDLIDFLPTNKQGADWLNRVMGDWMVRSGIPGATPDEEFTDSYSSRMIWGGVNLVFGAAEIVGGIALMGGTLGLGTVAGGAMTIAGFEAITQGIDFWRTPVESSHSTGWLGDGAYAMMTQFGVLDSNDQAAFNKYWAFAMLGLSLGGAGVMGFAGDAIQASRVGRAARTFDFVAEAPSRALATARMAIVAVRNSRFGRLLVNYAPLPSGRIIMHIQGIGRAVAPMWESLVRLRLRMHSAVRGPLRQRAIKLGAGDAGMTSLRGGVSSLQEARDLVYQAAAHMGISARQVDELVSGITLGSRTDTSALTVGGRLRVSGGVGFRRSATTGARTGAYNEFTAMHEIFHELHHALARQRFLQSGGTLQEYAATIRSRQAYALEEYTVEAAAQQWTRRIVEPRIARELRYGSQAEATRLRAMLAETIEESNEYMAHFRWATGQ